MSMKYLGETFDFHAGGLDLIFPHHENEIAQSEAATGKPFVKYWLHNGFLDIEGEKMSKSLGNFRTAREVLEKFPATAIRLFFLLKHYRGPINFSPEPIEHALKARERLNIAYNLLRRHLSEAPQAPSAKRIAHSAESKGQGATSNQQPATSNQPGFAELLTKFRGDFVAAMDDDFNTPEALAVVFDLVRETNRWAERDSLTPAELSLLAIARDLLDEWNSFLGVIETGNASVDQSRVNAIVEILLEVRQKLREEKNFKVADQIRNRLKEVGVIIEDGAQGSRWRWG
jgi:cysteinyl-tRNA synthetase